MPKYIKKKALKNAIECCTWYHINKNGELVEGANPADHEPLYKYSDIKKIIKGLPTRKFTDEPQTYITEDRDTQILDAWQVHNRNTTSAVEDEPQTDIYGLTDCDFCKGKNCEDCEGGKDEPKTDCPWK